MIKTFGDKATEDLYHGKRTKRVLRFPPDLLKTALRKLDMLNAATKLSDLRVPPNNRLEKLSGDLDGYWSIRVNDQWRIIFEWSDSDAYRVSLVDYH